MSGGEGRHISISLHVVNSYELYDTVERTVTGARIPAPPGPEGSAAYEQWAYENIYERFTGTGRTRGDSFYDVTVTDCSDSYLIGRTFDWGY